MAPLQLLDCGGIQSIIFFCKICIIYRIFVHKFTNFTKLQIYKNIFWIIGSQKFSFRHLRRGQKKIRHFGQGQLGHPPTCRHIEPCLCPAVPVALRRIETYRGPSPRGSFASWLCPGGGGCHPLPAALCLVALSAAPPHAYSSNHLWPPDVHLFSCFRM